MYPAYKQAVSQAFYLACGTELCNFCQNFNLLIRLLKANLVIQFNFVFKFTEIVTLLKKLKISFLILDHFDDYSCNFLLLMIHYTGDFSGVMKDTCYMYYLTFFFFAGGSKVCFQLPQVR